MKIITAISNHQHPGFFLLKLSCALNNLELVVLACERDKYDGHRKKDDLLDAYLSKIDSEEIVCFTDGYDSIMMTHEEELLKKYNKFNSGLVFSAEPSCYPDKSLQAQYPVVDSQYRYLNSGGFIGKAGLIRKLINEDIPEKAGEFKWSNQYIWSLRYLQHTDLIKLDTGCDLFCPFYTDEQSLLLPEQTRTDPDIYAKLFYEWFHSNFIIENGRIFNKVTRSWPCNAHFNGHAKFYLEKYMDIPEMLYSLLPGSRKIVFADRQFFSKKPYCRLQKN